ncbi:hypothetical protein [Methanoregula sp.]|uniref:hypothetical protein n=1 Tax=Methanoregula sp. TaxID=2052170 RepID=UPI002BA48A8F|nr:hypothetical protein [Methanoregula sp.]HVP96006.1 hypothetical protein [Methanoregula sp.]
MSSIITPALETFVTVIGAGLLIMGLSRLLDHIWAHSLRYPLLYLILTAPGVIVHECAHVIGCLLVGAKVRDVVLLSKEGGSVSYSPPAIPVLGNLIINTAPLFFLPLVLAALTWLFGTYTGCSFASAMPSLDTITSLFSMVEAIGTTLYQNLIIAFNPWFILYLYLVTSLAISFSPSVQDIRNAVAGLVILILAGLCILVINIPVIKGGFLVLLGLLATGLAIGLAFGLVALLVSLPALIFYRSSS